jgi:ubiquinone/menaquinone biosynthesis C-methylase UbiE
VQILLKPGVELTEWEPGIYSTGARVSREPFDRWAGVYDFLIRNRLYNGLMWGTKPASYVKFAQEAHSTNPQFLLDAGCGSMAVTAEAHAHSKTLVIGVDSSLPMLRRARKRLTDLNATNVILIHGTVEDLPFRANAFDSVLFMGMAHLFSDDSPVMSELHRVLMGRGRLYMSSLVENQRRIGDRFLAKLKARGEVKTIRTPGAVLDSIRAQADPIDSHAEGNMFFASAIR